MLDAALHFLWPDGMVNNTCLDPVDVLPPVASGFRLTETADGYVAMITVTDAQWKGCCRRSIEHRSSTIRLWPLSGAG